MRRTRKRGGFETDESGKFARQTTEINNIRDALRAVDSAPTNPEKIVKAKELLEILLFSKVAIRNRRFRDTVRHKLEQFWDEPDMFEHRRLIGQVMEYLNSIPESQITGGKRTQKKGGFEGDESGRFVNPETETRVIREAIREASTSSRDELENNVKKLLELLLLSNTLVRNRAFRNAMRSKIEIFWDIPRLYELRGLMRRAIAHFDSIPESEIVGGRRRKTRKIRRHRK